MAELTPFQTVGPFFSIQLVEPPTTALVDDATLGRRITIQGFVRDGEGKAVSDALIEVWQANAAGRYAHPDDAQQKPLDPHFTGYGRAPTNEDGHFVIRTIAPGRVPGESGALQAPHLLVGVLARGILTRLVTRIYLSDDPSTHDDAILRLVPAARRHTLIATRKSEGAYDFDIILQGIGETVFFDV